LDVWQYARGDRPGSLLVKADMYSILSIKVSPITAYKGIIRFLNEGGAEYVNEVLSIQLQSIGNRISA